MLKIFKKIVLNLPKPLRSRVIRNQLDTSEISRQIRFKVATTQEELEAAYRLLHDCYVNEGFQVPDPSGLRITKYFALPTTTTIVAIADEKVVGTMTIIRRTTFGLPIEQAFDLTNLVADGSVIAEISSLAVSKDFRGKKGSLFIPLCKFFYLFVKKTMRLEKMVITVHPRWVPFYEDILMFKKLNQGKRDNYDFANGNPAVALWADLATIESEFLQAYSRLPLRKNLHAYFLDPNEPLFSLPQKTYFTTSSPVMTPEMLTYFFQEKSTVITTLSSKEKIAILAAYPKQAYQNVFPFSNVKFIKQRSERFHCLTSAEALPMDGLQQHLRVEVLEFSRDGLRLRGNLREGSDLKIHIDSGDANIIQLMGKVVWGSKNIFGIRIIQPPQKWLAFIHGVNQEHWNYFPQEKVAS